MTTKKSTTLKHKLIKVNKARAKGVTAKITLDCTQVEKDNIIEVAGLEKFLIDHIKVDNKTGNFERINKETGKVEKLVVVSRNNAKIVIDVVKPFHKRYIKFLTKAYLRKQQIRDFLRVIATSPNAYTLKYFMPKAKTEA
eukprot:Protomagalhaensia_wolfi_Nauph_80__4115@NODE_4181_length_621_cov_123_273196_g3320_i0_p1_GENE_NODE_4181_length_621_cov_123_273196_g3320_i0NODE_4181_length_621_cov_123_273196_g3320_i0_p1_ORF_typecomplete_len140_score41_79Ribosomal_L22e/PF01776_17/3_3e29DHO_dh/PF01180_21/0_084_NODE_4181_length_621_cov_123_273196_g3320_i0137556